MISTIVIVIICFSIIIHHLYKIKDELNDIKEQIADSAKWADETMIEKACEWISQSYTSGVLDWKNCDSIIEDFKKAMNVITK